MRFAVLFHRILAWITEDLSVLRGTQSGQSLRQVGMETGELPLPPLQAELRKKARELIGECHPFLHHGDNRARPMQHVALERRHEARRGGPGAVSSSLTPLTHSLTPMRLSKREKRGRITYLFFSLPAKVSHSHGYWPP